jgi:hypothetical protein
MNILELAKQAGLKQHQEQAPGIDGVVGNWAELEVFADLVAAQEREECAKVCEEDGLLWGQRYAAAIRARGTT